LMETFVVFQALDSRVCGSDEVGSFHCY
jgi:hypothetical protein